MTTRDVGCALYAPLSLLVAGDQLGTRIEYDRPSSLFAQFEDRGVAEVAAELDAKFTALIGAAAGVENVARPRDAAD